MDQAGKWSAGIHYGPVLSQTDLYLLQTDLELHPILLGKHPSFHLVFNIVDGNAGGFNQNSRDRDLSFAQKDEPATMPRVAQLIVITEHSPWCTIVKNERGVTMEDICTQVYKDYTEHLITEAEFGSIPVRVQDQIKRISHGRAVGSAPGQWAAYYSPLPTDGRHRRVDWLRERTYFETLRRNDSYAISRLGFKAPNIFIMDLSN